MKFHVYVCIVCAFFSCASCSDADPSPEPGPLEQRIRSRVDEAAAAGFSGAALITVDGERVLAAGYGLADRQNAVANTPDTAFDVGSIMKDFTAAAIFKLAHEGKLDLRDSLSELFPNVPDDKADITVLQILQHRA